MGFDTEDEACSFLLLRLVRIRLQGFGHRTDNESVHVEHITIGDTGE